MSRPRQTTVSAGRQRAGTAVPRAIRIYAALSDAARSRTGQVALYVTAIAAPLMAAAAVVAYGIAPATSALDALVTAKRPTGSASGAATPSIAPQVTIVTRGAFSPTQDFNDQIKEPGFWAKRRSGSGGSSGWSSGSGAPRSNLGAPVPNEENNPFARFFQLFEPEPAPQPEVRSSYRTVCVRLCDGFFWPISSGTTPSNFQRDQRACEASCAGGARLFTYPNGSEPEAMVDVRGNAYINLPTAFAFRTKYDPMCKCKPHPWEQEAQDQHRVYALEQQRRRGGPMSRPTAQQIAELEARIGDARREREQATLDYVADALNGRTTPRRQTEKTQLERHSQVQPTVKSDEPDPPTGINPADHADAKAPIGPARITPPAEPARPTQTEPRRQLITPGLSPRAQTQPDPDVVTAAKTSPLATDVHIMRLGAPTAATAQPPVPDAKADQKKAKAPRKAAARTEARNTPQPSPSPAFRFPQNDNR